MTNEELLAFFAENMARQPHGLRSTMVARVIEDAVRMGNLHAGDMLPAERRLCETFSVSRTTLRSALNLLVDAGLVDRRPGSGNFIQPRALAPKQPLTGHTQDVESRGMKPVSKVLTIQRGLVTPDECFNLGLAPGSKVMRLERFRAADQNPVSIELSIIPVFAVPESYDGNTSLYAAMDECNCRPTKVIQRYGATLATAEQAELLGTTVDGPLLVLQRLGFSQDRRAVEFTRSLFKGDRMFISTELDI